MLKLKLQYFGHLMQSVDSLEKTDAGRALICARLAEGSGVRRNKGGGNAVALPELTVKAAMS